MNPGQDEGTLIRWFDDRGFGFIAPDTGGREVFVHATSFARGTTPQPGARLAYVTVEAEKGRRAVGVRAVEAHR